MLSSTTCTAFYTGDGAHDEYSYPFKVFVKTDLLVTYKTSSAATTETAMTVDVDYTVNDVGEEAGGTITLTSNLGDGYILSIKRIMPLTQETSYANQTAFHPETHEASYDKAIMIDQQLNAGLSGALRLPDTIDPSDVDTTLPLPVAGTIIVYNGDADGFDGATIAEIDPDAVVMPTGTGLAVVTATDTFGTCRTLTAGDGITITNGSGVSGNPTVAITSVTSLCPAGAILPYGGSSAPTGWLWCNGANVSRTTYAALFAAIGTTFGSGDGSTTFGLPDSRGRVPMGYNPAAGAGGDATLDVYAMGGEGGEEEHLLITNEIPSHHHTIPSTTGSHSDGSESCEEVGGTGATYDTGNTGGGLPHANMQPYFTVNYIIKT